MQLGYFHVMAEPVSTCVHEILARSPRHIPLFVTKLYIPPFPCLSPGYQFCTVEYFTSALFMTTISTIAACNWFSSRIGAVQPSRYETYESSSATISVRSNCPVLMAFIRK